jgi:hypothetical protein
MLAMVAILATGIYIPHFAENIPPRLAHSKQVQICMLSMFFSSRPSLSHFPQKAYNAR